MKRVLVVLALAAALVGALFQSAALADPPPTNKNASVLTFSCTRGSETIGFQAVGIAQSNQPSGQLLVGTSVVHFVQIIGSSGQVFFEVPGQLGRPDLWSCTLAEFPGGVGLVFLTPRG
jgi:hypothetical protein